MKIYDLLSVCGTCTSRQIWMFHARLGVRRNCLYVCIRRVAVRQQFERDRDVFGMQAEKKVEDHIELELKDFRGFVSADLSDWKVKSGENERIKLAHLHIILS